MTDGRRPFAAFEWRGPASGLRGADRLLQHAPLAVLEMRPIPPGRYLLLVTGEVEALASAHARALRDDASALEDHAFLPALAAPLVRALEGPLPPLPAGEAGALGTLETRTLASTFLAADAALKAARVHLSELRLATGLWGRAFFVLEGPIGEVEAALEAGVRALEDRGTLLDKSLVARPDAVARDRVVARPDPAAPLAPRWPSA